MMRLTLADAVKFHLAGDPMSGTPVFAEKRKWAPDERWAVTRAGSCLNKGGGWEYEPSPSSRTEAFFERTRWATAEAAAEAYLATQAERERASLARGSGPGNSADREGTHAPSHPRSDEPHEFDLARVREWSGDWKALLEWNPSAYRELEEELQTLYAVVDDTPVTGGIREEVVRRLRVARGDVVDDADTLPEEEK